MTIKKLTKDTLIYEEGQENSLDIINNNFEELDNSNVKLNSENIFTKDQTIKHDWVSLNLDFSSHSSLRYKLNWIDIFALSVWSEKDFKISRFVNWNWVWNVLVINNNDWNIQINWEVSVLGNDWTSNLIIDNTQNSVVRFKKNGKDVFTNAIDSNNNFIISRFVNWIWVNNSLTIRNDTWAIILGNVPTSPAGLTSWCVWRDGENLKIIP